MQVISIQKILLGTILLICGMLVSINWSPKNGLKISLAKPAYARIGRPATPASVAGVHRRAYRRSHYYNNNYYYNNSYYNNGYYNNGYYYYGR